MSRCQMFIHVGCSYCGYQMCFRTPDSNSPVYRQWYGMVPLLPPRSQSVRPGARRRWHLDRAPAELWVLPGCLAEPSAQTESVPSALVWRVEMGFVSTGASGSRAACCVCCELAPFLSVLSGSPPAQRDTKLHGRPVEVESDQLELAREVVPVGVCPSLQRGASTQSPTTSGTCQGASTSPCVSPARGQPSAASDWR
jgi:hypothetical protein